MKNKIIKISIAIVILLYVISITKVGTSIKLSLTYMLARTSLNENNRIGIRGINYYGFSQDCDLDYLTEECDRIIKHSDIWKDSYTHNVIYINDYFNLNKHNIYGLYRDGYCVIIGDNVNPNTVSHELVHSIIDQAGLSGGYLEEGYCDYIGLELYNYKTKEQFDNFLSNVQESPYTTYTKEFAYLKLMYPYISEKDLLTLDEYRYHEMTMN